MTGVDWWIVVAYAVIAVAIGLRFAKRASANAENFFVAGRSLPWIVAGTSMVATTFSSDTPLWVAGAVRSDGVAAVWLMWAGIFGTLATVFYFARLWRRSEALTEVELIVQRYESGIVTHGLRVFKALFDGVFVNCIIMASVTLAMSKILAVVLGLSEEALFVLPVFGPVDAGGLILILLSAAALFYTMLSGLYGVVYTDLIQFGLAMIGAFALAIIVYVDLLPQGGLVAQLVENPAIDAVNLNLFPDFGWNVPTATFVILVTIGWLFSAPGTGFYLQRVLATRTERDAMLSVYWYCFCNYVLRSWPWIVVGIASLIYFPALIDAESAYPAMLNELLPVGLKGIMVTSLLAAFMSTLDTHLNWGSSYLINDVYRPYVSPDRPNSHYVTAGRIAMAVLVVVAVIIASRLTGLLNAYKYLGVFWAGASFVLIARWYWWRINAWSEVATLLCAVIFGNALFFILPDAEGQDLFAIRMAANFFVTTAVCIGVTYLTTAGTPGRHVISFYNRMRIHGPGWARVRRVSGIRPISVDLKQSTYAFAASSVFMISLLLLCGYAIFLNWPLFAVNAFLCVVSGAYLIRRAKHIVKESFQDSAPE